MGRQLSKFKSYQAFIICLILPILANSKDIKGSTAKAVNKKLVSDSEESKFQSLQTLEAKWTAYLLRQKNVNKQISGLEIPDKKVKVFYVVKGEEAKPLVKISVKYPEELGKLYLIGGTPVKKNPESGLYEIYLYLNSRISEVTIISKLKNKQNSERIFVYAPEVQGKKISKMFDSILFNFGLAHIGYEQTSFGIFTADTLLLGASYITPESGRKLGFMADFDITVLTTKSEPLEQNPQFYNALVAATYAKKLYEDPRTRSRFVGGVRSMGLVSHGSPFGFKGLLGADIGVRTTYFLNRKDSFVFETHYVSYEGIGLDKDRGLVLELAWFRNLETLRQVRFNFTAETHNFVKGLEVIDLEFLTLGAAISF